MNSKQVDVFKLEKIRKGAQELILEKLKQFSDEELEEEKEWLYTRLPDDYIVYDEDKNMNIVETFMNCHEYMYKRGLQGKSIVLHPLRGKLYKRISHSN